MNIDLNDCEILDCEDVLGNIGVIVGLIKKSIVKRKNFTTADVCAIQSMGYRLLLYAESMEKKINA